MLPEERKRYSRQIILPEVGLAGQEKLRAARILVVGAGGLGCPVLQYLAAAGIGTLGIVDDDTIDISNLHRQIIYSGDDIGKKKAETAALKLGQMYPFTAFSPIVRRIDESNAKDIIGGYDLIIDGSDNFPTRYALDDACHTLGKPWVFGSILRFEGQLSVFNYHNGPTYRSLFPDADEGENCAEAGVIGILPGIIGTYMVNEAIKIVCGIGHVLSGQLMVINTLANTTNIFRFGKTPEQPEPLRRPEPDTKAQELSMDIYENTASREPERYLLVDVREEYEFEEDFVGGINIPLPDLPGEIASLPQSRSIVFYCKSGKRSRNAALLLEKSNYSGEIFWMKDQI